MWDTLCQLRGGVRGKEGRVRKRSLGRAREEWFPGPESQQSFQWRQRGGEAAGPPTMMGVGGGVGG